MTTLSNEQAQLVAIYPILQNATIRRMPNTQHGSLIDLAAVVTGAKPNYAARIIRCILKEHPEVETKCSNFKFPGRGQRHTPVADAATMMAVMTKLPGNAAKKFLHAAMLHVCRLFAGDVTLVPEILARHAAVAGTEVEAFFMDPVNQAKRREQRDKARCGTKRKAEALHDNIHGATPADYRKANGQLNKAATGMNKRELGAKLGITKKLASWTARDFFTEEQLSFVASGEYASAAIFRAHDSTSPEITEKKRAQILKSVATLAALAGEHGHFLEAPLSARQAVCAPPVAPAAPSSVTNTAAVTTLNQYFAPVTQHTSTS